MANGVGGDMLAFSPSKLEKIIEGHCPLSPTWKDRLAVCDGCHQIVRVDRITEEEVRGPGKVSVFEFFPEGQGESVENEKKKIIVQLIRLIQHYCLTRELVEE